MVTYQRGRRRDKRLEPLVAANLSDLYRAFGVGDALRPYAAPLLEPFAQRFALELRRCNEHTAEVGVQRAMREALKRFGARLETFGTENIPASGPLLITANHPGLADAPALLASLGRTDLKIVSADRDLLRALPAIHARLIVVDAAQPQRSAAQVVRHLRAGGAVLTFPAGRIEPDPALGTQAAAAALTEWSQSVALFARLEPRTLVVPAIVAGVVTPETLTHPLVRLRRPKLAPEQKAWLAASLQVMLKRYQHNHVTVRYGLPLTDTENLHARTLRRSEELIRLSAEATEQGENALY